MGKKEFVVHCFVVIFFMAIAAQASDDLMKNAQDTFKPIPKSISMLKGKAISPEKIELGKMLFFEPRLSASGLISCNTCHNLGTGGVDLQETSTGHGWQRGPRNAPTVLNAVFNIAQFWDGRAADLKEQAQGPPLAPIEMATTRERFEQTLKSMPEYVALFEKAFATEKDPVSYVNASEAIEAFETTLLTPDSPFDKFIEGNEGALSAKEKEGLNLFMGKGCSGCHNGINMGGGSYQTFGVVSTPKAEIIAGDTGRFKITKDKSDKFAFKVPSLRNIALTPPYFHSGKIWSLKEAVSIMGVVQLGISLTGSEIDKIEAFLKTTTGVQPKVVFPILPASTESTPKPKLD